MKAVAHLAIALPLGEAFELAWLHGIQPALREMELRNTRLNTLLTTEEQRQYIRQNIAEADCLLADLSGNNPAVCYCIAAAEALDKPVIIMARHAETVALSGTDPTLAYADDPNLLRSSLISRLSQGTPQATIPTSAPKPVQQTADRERFLELFGDVLVKHQYEDLGEVHCENKTTFVLLEQNMDLALVQDLARRAREHGLRLKLL